MPTMSAKLLLAHLVYQVSKNMQIHISPRSYQGKKK